MTSPAPAWLVSFESYKNGDIYFHISSYINSLEKAQLAASVRYIERFLNQEYRFAIP